ncbi:MULTISPECIES: hypothetical protein [unclassified Microbacterium]|uniref:hypothetical protein n=1 Tax=unclassified Microbacterium TaxID=2609290 RepID=UPI0016050117|nr:MULTISPECIES: hypothetical protein [unclassified Microbacterium]QNA91403.1 hypothetical protein G4G29_01220 [Microbacterium sp. Se63.02b]QYM64569.1 hypothetical protein K1X59_01230 [Microbacterium sp. Se5.02b]
MEKTVETSTTSWIPGTVWVLLGAGVVFIWIPVVSFVCIVLGLLTAYVGVPKTNSRRRAMLIVGWGLLAALALVLVVGATVWNSFQLL